VHRADDRPEICLQRSRIPGERPVLSSDGLFQPDGLHLVRRYPGRDQPLIDAVLAASPGQVEAYRGGKEGLLGFFVGQVMKETGGKANPKVVSDLLREKLKA